MLILTQWFKRHFSDPGVVFLALFLVISFAVVIIMGDMLMPVLASVVIAYLLEGIVGVMEKRGLPRFAAVLIVYSIFMLFVTLVLFGMLPILSRQVTELFQQLPTMISQGQQVMMQLPDRYPDIVSAEQVQEFIGIIRQEIAEFGQKVVSLSLSSVLGVIIHCIHVLTEKFLFQKTK